MRGHFLLIFLLLAGCADRTVAPVLQDAAAVGEVREVLVGTTRRPNAEGGFGIGRAPVLRLMSLDVSVPPEREVGTVSVPIASPDPERDFVLAGRRDHADAAAFTRDLRRQLQARPAGQRDVTIFVHGFNTSFAGAAFRTAQLAHDLDAPGVFIAYAWPSRGNTLGYQYDEDSVAFARDGLEQLMRLVHRAGADNLVMVAHSLGAELTVEALRQIDIADPGWSARSLAGVVLISPDLNTEVFKSQIRRISPLPQPFVVVVSRRDMVLKISARLRGETTRLGTLNDVRHLRGLPIQVVDVTAFGGPRGGNHFVAGSSPALIRLLRDRRSLQALATTGQSITGRTRGAARASLTVLNRGPD